MYSTDELLVKVDIRLIDGYTVLDITHRLLPLDEGGIGAIRKSINPVSRELELSISSLQFDNLDGYFTPEAAGGLFTKGSYNGLRVRVYIGLRTEAGVLTAPAVHFTGFIDYIHWEGTTRTAEFKLYDVLDGVRLLQVDPAQIGVLISASDSPANVALAILRDKAGVPVEMIDLASFSAAHTIESTATQLMKNFKLLAGSYYQNLQTVLAHGNASLSITKAGLVRYVRWLPDLTAGAVVLEEQADILSISGYESTAAVRNTIRVQRGTGADPAAGTGTWFTRTSEFEPNQAVRSAPDLLLIYFSANVPAWLVADRLIDFQSQPAGTYSISCHFNATTAALELGQLVLVNAASFFPEKRTLQIIDVVVQPGSARVNLVGYDVAIQQLPWLYTNNAQQLDAAQLIY